MVYLLLGNGFEEAEAIIPCDLLRRAGIAVQLVGVDARSVTGGHGITLTADCTLRELNPAEAEMLILPGGLGGVQTLHDSPEVCALIRTVAASGGYLAAICAAPTLLAELGLLTGCRAVCYPGMEAELDGAVVCSTPAVTDGKRITGRAAGSAFDFALALICALRGEQAAQRVAEAIVYQGGNHV